MGLTWANVAVAAAVCIAGSIVTARLFERSRDGKLDVSKYNILAAGLVFGTMSWIVFLTISGVLVGSVGRRNQPCRL